MDSEREADEFNRAMDERYLARNQAARFRREMAKHPGMSFEIKCYNKAEADEIKALLTDEELARCRLTWMEFGK